MLQWCLLPAAGHARAYRRRLSCCWRQFKRAKHLLNYNNFQTMCLFLNFVRMNTFVTCLWTFLNWGFLTTITHPKCDISIFVFCSIRFTTSLMTYQQHYYLISFSIKSFQGSTATGWSQGWIRTNQKQVTSPHESSREENPWPMTRISQF